MPNNILVRGRPGSGKTTLVLRLVRRLLEDGFKASGFVTEEIRENNSRKGFMVRDLRGKSAVLAHIDYRGGFRVGRYGVDIDSFERIASRAIDAERVEGDLTVVDEIGRMELASEFFRSAILELMDNDFPLLATIHEKRDEFSESLLDRYDICLHRITVSGRDELEEVVYRDLREMIADRVVSNEREGGEKT